VRTEVARKATRTDDRKLGERKAAVVDHAGALEEALPKATQEKDLAHVVAEVKDLAKAGKPAVITFDIDDTLVQTQSATPGKAEPGALAYVKEIAAAGGHVVYLTARPFFFKGKTTKELTGLGFPVGDGQTLMMNPDPKKWNAVAWKENAKPLIEKIGKPVAFFDNDLANVRMLRTQYTKSEVFRVDTVDGHKDPGGKGNILVIKDFN
jgi:predicted secreted acid phosphatase